MFFTKLMEIAKPENARLEQDLLADIHDGITKIVNNYPIDLAALFSQRNLAISKFISQRNLELNGTDYLFQILTIENCSVASVWSEKDILFVLKTPEGNYTKNYFR